MISLKAQRFDWDFTDEELAKHLQSEIFDFDDLNQVSITQYDFDDLPIGANDYDEANYVQDILEDDIIPFLGVDRILRTRAVLFVNMCLNERHG